MNLEVQKTPLIKVTNDHKVWALRNRNEPPNWWRVDELNKYSYIGIPNSKQFNDQPITIDLANYLEVIKESKPGIRITVEVRPNTLFIQSYWHHSNLTGVNHPVEVSREHTEISRYWTFDENFCKFVGAFYGGWSYCQ